MLGFLWCLIRDALLLLGHLSGGGSFPKPLSRQEEAQALAAMQAGQIMDEVFHRFGIRVCIKMNNRKILSGIAEIIGEADKIVDITVAIDKLDKIGLDNVNEELRSKGLPEEAIERLSSDFRVQYSD